MLWLWFLLGTLSVKLRELKNFLLLGKISKRRKLWKECTDFVWLYKWLFNDFIYEAKNNERPEISLIIAEYLYRNGPVADKEINASGCCLEIMTNMEIKIDFNK